MIVMLGIMAVIFGLAFVGACLAFIVDAGIDKHSTGIAMAVLLIAFLCVLGIQYKVMDYQTRYTPECAK